MKIGYRNTGAAAVLALCGAMCAASEARAEMTLYDKDGWTLKHDGLLQGIYSLSTGDSKPSDVSTNPTVPGFGGWDSPPAGTDGKFVSSRFRSGWTGGRFNWVAGKQLDEDTKVSGVLGIAYSISTDDAPAKTNNLWDVRNAHLKIEAPWGELTIGRGVGLYTLGAIISVIQSTSAPLGLGNACETGNDYLGCYMSGYGMKFPGFWAGVFYQTPSIGGLKIKVAALDPETAGAAQMVGNVPVSQLFARRPLPMFQTLVRYEGDFGSVKIIPHFNGFWQKVGKADSSDSLNPMGGGAGLDLQIGSLHVGGGATVESGTSFYGPFYSKASIIDGAGKLRGGSSFYGHALYSINGIVDLSAGYGKANISRTDWDTANDFNINKNQSNIHAAIQWHWFPSVTFLAEVNVLRHEWHKGNVQNVQLFNLGGNFAY